MKEKIKEKEDLRRAVEDFKREGKRIVFTNGCFDLLHVGHIRYLEKAKTLGDILVVGVNSDRSVKELKGPFALFSPGGADGDSLGAWCVDYVTLFDEPTPLELITALKPTCSSRGRLE